MLRMPAFGYAPYPPDAGVITQTSKGRSLVRMKVVQREKFPGKVYGGDWSPVQGFPTFARINRVYLGAMARYWSRSLSGAERNAWDAARVTYASGFELFMAVQKAFFWQKWQGILLGFFDGLPPWPTATSEIAQTILTNRLRLHVTGTTAFGHDIEADWPLLNAGNDYLQITLQRVRRQGRLGRTPRMMFDAVQPVGFGGWQPCYTKAPNILGPIRAGDSFSVQTRQIGGTYGGVCHQVQLFQIGPA
jgi:hypothetical protein